MDCRVLKLIFFEDSLKGFYYFNLHREVFILIAHYELKQDLTTFFLEFKKIFHIRINRHLFQSHF